MDEYLRCIRCGLCLSVCPTYREILSETASPRGRVALLRKGLEGELELSNNLIEQMYACFSCLACNEICPVGIQPAKLALDLRQVHEQNHPTVWKDTIFDGLIAKPERIELATLLLRFYQILGLRRMVHRMGLFKILPQQVSDIEAMLPRQPRRPLRKVLPKISEAGPVNRYRVGFFLGCTQSLMFAEQSAATIRVLVRNACNVITPNNVVCCGMPAVGYGRQDLALAQARHNIELFERAQVDTIITDCATCGSTLRGYGDLLRNDKEWMDRANRFSSRVRDVCEFLESIPLESPQGVIEARVTYHDPCHLRRGQGVWEQPRNLLKRIKGLEFVELLEADWCCGAAGSQLITHYQTSLKVLNRKIDHLEHTNARYIATGCPGCQMQLNVGIRRRRLKVDAVHPISLLDRAYR